MIQTEKHEPGTEVLVQSNRTAMVYEAYVDDEGRVRYDENGAVFNEGAYTLIGEDNG